MAIKGIDVSEFQGEINWNEVKNDGIELAILKLGNIYDYDTNFRATNPLQIVLPNALTDYDRRY